MKEAPEVARNVPVVIVSKSGIIVGDAVQYWATA